MSDPNWIKLIKKLLDDKNDNRENGSAENK